MQILAMSPGREAGGQWLAGAPGSWWGGAVPTGRSSLPACVQGPSRALGGSYLLPLGCSHGTKWAPGPGALRGARLGVVPAGADFRSGGPRGSLGRGPRSSLGSFSSGTKATFTAVPKPRAPQTGLGRLILTEGPCVPRWPTRPRGVPVALHLPDPCLRRETEAVRTGEKQSSPLTA